jgi:acetylornithine deacetylase/succinyl-diaminopimelate desuccinylase-like protein
MKGGMAMMLAALLRAKAEGFAPAGDIIFAVLSDEEGGGDFGARYLVETHPEQFDGIRYALGELGGFTFYVGSQRFFPIQVAEKQMCWMMAAVRGPSGHGALPLRGGAMAKLGKMLQQLDRCRLPIHITSSTRQMIETMAGALPFPTAIVLRQLLNPLFADRVLGLLGEKGRTFEPLLRNTVNVTVVQGGDKVNVIPSEVSLELDGRLLPGFGPDDIIKELRTILSRDIELKVVRHDPGPSEPDMGLFDTLANILTNADRGSSATPFMVPGVTDARFFSRLGIQTYGFTPMNLPLDC